MKGWKVRVQIAVHVLRGRPAIYGVHFEDGIKLPEPDNLLVMECLFTSSEKPKLSIYKRLRLWLSRKLGRVYDREAAILFRV